MPSGAIGPVLAGSCGDFVQYTVPYAVTTLIVSSAYWVMPGWDDPCSARTAASFPSIGRSARGGWLFLGAGMYFSSSVPIRRAESSKVWTDIAREVVLGVARDGGVACFSIATPAAGAGGIFTGACIAGRDGDESAFLWMGLSGRTGFCRPISELLSVIGLL